MVRRRDDDGPKDGPKPKRNKAANDTATARFAIEKPGLPKAIDDAAMSSGDYPYAKKLKRGRYEEELRSLQIELLKLQAWVKDTGERLVVVFEGRDAAGKGGTINRFTQHLNPRGARVVALPKPTEAEAGQWYFQRYVAALPTAGEIVFFDRSWYNRAGVERVMGFCSPDETEHFLHEAPVFEHMLVRDGIRLVKLFLTIGREMQMKRLHARYHNLLKRWKLSPIDFEAINRWDDYSRAYEAMLRHTSTSDAPWTVVRANDKLRARLGAIRHLLEVTPYRGKDKTALGESDGRIVLDARRFLVNGGEPEVA
ncbi:polyphosphate kinase 2 [Chelatococcus sp. SYSU_G07232]|uniref:ADP/GDP-polyphosphate phosphotransferase n=1 Tax=Chelatococcus albus TaxID=3047466 RepID=A0ABT7AF83_9HYPH|nr:polyphosphate kinase 2 [Chelatococcus sp. SYSU_G07232]MDJ1158022.1 polyphosphate kinase 2 [Chelatococcus sp. SYSU_G07232]